MGLGCDRHVQETNPSLWKGQLARGITRKDRHPLPSLKTLAPPPIPPRGERRGQSHVYRGLEMRSELFQGLAAANAREKP